MDTAALLKENASLKSQNDTLNRDIHILKMRVEWLERQMFGAKSEKRQDDSLMYQVTLDFGDNPILEEPPAEEEVAVPAHKRTKKRSNEIVTEQGLRFEDHVPVDTILVEPPELKDNPDAYEILTRHSYRIAQNPVNHRVIHIEYRSIKHKKTQEVISVGALPNVLEKSVTDVSFLAMMVIDKLLYHLPLYRQHQRLTRSGIHVARKSLSNWMTKVGQLLKPIYDAQKASILLSQVLAIDETPIKAGRNPNQHKMNTGVFWPLYGDKDEVVFIYTDNKQYDTLKGILSEFIGTLLTDGNSTYAKYAKKVNQPHAECWAHARRQFEKAQSEQPGLVAIALDYIGAIFRFEKRAKKQKLSIAELRDMRQLKIRPVVDNFFNWCQHQLTEVAASRHEYFIRALNYILNRDETLKIFLSNPEVALDTNHLERAIRPIPMGRKNWLFCWSELGAETIGICQSLLTTCKLHGVDPYTYLVDVLQRISDHPASKVEQLTPRLWKEHFADNPMRSVIDLR